MSTESITLLDPSTGNRLVCLAVDEAEHRERGWRHPEEIGHSA